MLTPNAFGRMRDKLRAVIGGLISGGSAATPSNTRANTNTVRANASGFAERFVALEARFTTLES